MGKVALESGVWTEVVFTDTARVQNVGRGHIRMVLGEVPPVDEDDGIVLHPLQIQIYKAGTYQVTCDLSKVGVLYFDYSVPTDVAV
jgi:hypothetical protein